MITGDHISTATAIAKKLTIVDPNEPGMSHSMEGYQVDLVSEEFLSTMRPFPTVFARVRYSCLSSISMFELIKAFATVRTTN